MKIWNMKFRMSLEDALGWSQRVWSASAGATNLFCWSRAFDWPSADYLHYT